MRLVWVATTFSCLLLCAVLCCVSRSIVAHCVSFWGVQFCLLRKFPLLSIPTVLSSLLFCYLFFLLLLCNQYGNYNMFSLWKKIYATKLLANNIFRAEEID